MRVVLLLAWLVAPSTIALSQSSHQNVGGGWGSQAGSRPRHAAHSRRPHAHTGHSILTSSRGGLHEQSNYHSDAYASLAMQDVVDSELSLATHGMSPGDGVACQSCGAAEFCTCIPGGCLFDWSRCDLWVGTVGFSTPASFPFEGTSTREGSGSFGFQEGFNFGSQMPGLWCGQVGSQFGMRLTQTQLDGSPLSTGDRTQTFLTAGLYRRVDYGLQGGLVVDYLHDQWIYRADLLQLRGELSFLFTPCHDFGFRFTDNQRIEDVSATVRGQTSPLSLRVASLNTYRFFYRFRFGDCGRGLAECQAGFTEDSGGIFGVHLKTPLHSQVGLEIGTTYGYPPENASNAYSQETWNVDVAVVWTPGRMYGMSRDYYRPLMDVAHNGSFISRLMP